MINALRLLIDRVMLRGVSTPSATHSIECSRAMAVALSTVLYALSLTPSHAQSRKADPAKGKVLFKQRCGVCHSTVASAPAAIAPNLAGVVGRPAGSTSFNYSRALKKFAQPWTITSLDKFLTAPGAMVPGTFMAISVPKPDERRDIVAYLATNKGAPASK